VKAIDIAHTSKAPLALVVLLTDGETTVGESEPSVILKAARDSNRREQQCPSYEDQNQATEAPCSIFFTCEIYYFELNCRLVNIHRPHQTRADLQPRLWTGGQHLFSEAAVCRELWLGAQNLRRRRRGDPTARSLRRTRIPGAS
jgi:hypothetical protein